MVPRALTWLHLLPGGAQFACDAGPDWLRDGLSDLSVAGGRRARIVWDAARAGLAGLDSDDVVVTFNGGRIAAGVLRSAGFKHVRRFAVLPGLADPRWFIPIGRPAVSAAGFSLYTPARFSARLKRLAAQAAAHTRLPIWYRDQICIAQHAPPPLEQAVQRLFGGEEIYLALSSGAPEGARNRKASVAVIDRAGRLRCFLKIAQSDLARGLLKHEQSVLRSLDELPGGRPPAPRLLSAGQIDGSYVTAQTPLPGGPPPVALKPAHLRFLRGLMSRECAVVANTELVRSLSARISGLPEPRPLLAAAFERVMPFLESLRLPIGIMHGDFAPWNLRHHRGQIAAFDWEYGRLHAPAGLDEIHYRLQVGYLLENWTVERAIESSCGAPLQSCPPGVGGQDLRVLHQLYLLDMLTRLFEEGYDQRNDMLKWKLELLSRLTAALPREAAIA